MKKNRFIKTVNTNREFNDHYTYFKKKSSFDTSIGVVSFNSKKLIFFLWSMNLYLKTIHCFVFVVGVNVTVSTDEINFISKFIKRMTIFSTFFSVWKRTKVEK